MTMETVKGVGGVLTSWIWMGDVSGEMTCQTEECLRTDVVIKENGRASGMEVLEPSKVINLTINDDPLKGE
jgi:hypothetical protein